MASPLCVILKSEAAEKVLAALSLREFSFLLRNNVNSVNKSAAFCKFFPHSIR